MVQDKAILTMADQYKVVYDLSIGAISSDLERPLTQISRSVSQILDVEYGTNGPYLGLQ